ncbi:MAG: YceI family protein [Brevundimonas sp.]
MRTLAFVVCLLAVAPAAADVETWRADPASSSVELTVQALGSSQRGRFERFEADIRIDPDRPQAAEVAVEVAAASLAMSNRALTARAVGPQFLDAGRHPTLRFQLLSLTSDGPDRFRATADIWAKGRRTRVVFPCALRFEQGRAQMTGGFDLDRAELGIGTDGPWNRLISRRVRIDVNLTARRVG